MRKILTIICIILSGCSSYNNHFDCPVPENGIKCQSISEVARKMQSQDDFKTVYVQQCYQDESCN